ncbi:MAG TPA: restriction endonuclease, partial [Solirubrobacteraceae bacterium]|nr:restriction endonuclease [Solirubrobacteraceae bacterium]
MLSDAVAAYLESVSERAFDEPLMALLRARGFASVRLVHGAREFGKDVIAQRGGEQWGFQSKAGNMGQSEWRALTGQLDELRVVNLGHGAFNTDLPRRPVLVTTGRLVGNAPELYGD